MIFFFTGVSHYYNCNSSNPRTFYVKYYGKLYHKDHTNLPI